MGVRAGQLRHRLTLRRPSTTYDGDGQQVETFKTLAEVWGRVRPLSGREFLLAQQGQQRLTHEVTIRYFEGLTPSDQVVHQNRTLNVHAVLDVDERGVTTRLMCEEVV